MFRRLLTSLGRGSRASDALQARGSERQADGFGALTRVRDLAVNALVSPQPKPAGSVVCLCAQVSGKHDANVTRRTLLPSEEYITINTRNS